MHAPPSNANPRTAPAPRSGGRRLTTGLLSCGLILGPVFVVVFLVEGATRLAYDPVRLPVSLLVLGEGGWTQTANFLLDGLALHAGHGPTRVTGTRVSWA